MTITDEMVQMALKKWWELGWDFGDEDGDEKAQFAMRAALEAVAPMIIAEELRGFIYHLRKCSALQIVAAIDARAQELDPQ